MDGAWWRDGVLYHIYIRSFSDSDGDGIGDLRGVISKLDHVAWLGVDGIWLSPVTPSPNEDWGYDVSDYCAVDPTLGTMDDFDRLVAEAGARGMRVLGDLVPNHSSDRHPWFVESRSSHTDPKRDWFVADREAHPRLANRSDPPVNDMVCVSRQSEWNLLEMGYHIGKEVGEKRESIGSNDLQCRNKPLPRSRAGAKPRSVALHRDRPLGEQGPS